MKENMWTSYDGKMLSTDLRSEAHEIIANEIAQGTQLKVCIGTDSHAHAHHIEFATVVVFLRKNQGGRMMIKKWKEYKTMSINERMLTEVGYSIETAYSLLELLDKYKIGLEVHADINTDPKFKSEKSLAAAKGYITAMGFEFKSKPDAFASSCCADKFVN